MTKNSTSTVGRNDNMIKASTFTVPVGKLASEISRLGLTVDRIAGIFYDATNGNVHVPYITGTLDAATKGKALIAAPNYPALMAWANIKDMQNIEIHSEGRIDAIAWLPVLEQIKTVKDKYGHGIVEFYGVGYGTKATSQFVVLGDKRILNLTPDNSIGVTSVRYDFTNRRYYGIRINQHFQGTGIVTLELGTVSKNPLAFTNIDAWKVIEDHVEPAMISFSRVKIVDNVATFFVNQVGNTCKVASITNVADDLILGWEEVVNTSIMMIGLIETEGLFVGYRLAEQDHIEIYLDKPKAREFPFLTLSI